ncbi:involucrin-like [Procambarus clarkii]|uniref:involucrin-like n=1 Tax=Procambarus clarkii TaxID=6728 RepID=UPI00374252C6
MDKIVQQTTVTQEIDSLRQDGAQEDKQRDMDTQTTSNGRVVEIPDHQDGTTKATAQSSGHSRSTESYNTRDRQQPMQSDMHQHQQRSIEQQRCTGSNNTRGGHEQAMQPDMQQHQQRNIRWQICTDSDNTRNGHEQSVQSDVQQYQQQSEGQQGCTDSSTAGDDHGCAHTSEK